MNILSHKFKYWIIEWKGEKNKNYNKHQIFVSYFRRKRSSERGEVVETPGDLIVKKITMERIDELKAQIREDKARFKQLKKEIEEIRSGALDDKLQDMCNEIQRWVFFGHMRFEEQVINNINNMNFVWSQVDIIENVIPQNAHKCMRKTCVDTQ